VGLFDIAQPPLPFVPSSAIAPCVESTLELRRWHSYTSQSTSSNGYVATRLDINLLRLRNEASVQSAEARSPCTKTYWQIEFRLPSEAWINRSECILMTTCGPKCSYRGSESPITCPAFLEVVQLCLQRRSMMNPGPNPWCSTRGRNAHPAM
jgi:hypothetical protein